MVNANELRIGNWLEYHLYGEKCVQQIDQFDFEFISEGILRCANPIQLSKDWLIKFGFLKIADLNNSYVFPSQEFGYTIIGNDKGGWFMMFFNTIKIEYVHQIQNIYFAITGQELTLNQLNNAN